MTEVPPDFLEALRQAGVGGFFADCTPAHRREYLKWIGEAKRPGTRVARINQAIEMITCKCAEEMARSHKKT